MKSNFAQEEREALELWNSATLFCRTKVYRWTGKIFFLVYSWIIQMPGFKILAQREIFSK